MSAKFVEVMTKTLSCTTGTKESEEIQALQKANAALQAKINLLQKELDNLKAQNNHTQVESKNEIIIATNPIAVNSQAQKQEVQCQQSQTKANQAENQTAKGAIANGPDQQKEKWVWDHMSEWLDMPCPFGKADKRTWRQLAHNEGEKIVLKGKPAVPRAYLHSLETWQECNVWSRLKAKVALEYCKNGNGNGIHS